MATIPDVPRLSPVKPRSQGIVSGPGPTRFDPLEHLAGDVNRLVQVRDRDQLARADVNFQLVKTEQDNAFDEREDYEKFDEDYTSKLEEARAVSAQGISDPILRDQWLNERQVDVLKGREQIKQKARQKYVDQERGRIQEDIDILRRTAATVGDVGQIYSAITERLSAAADTNVISFEEAQAWGEEWRTSATLSKLQGLAPEERITALNKDWVKFLQPHVVKQLRDEAQEEIRVNMAVREAHDLLKKEPDATAARAHEYFYAKFGVNTAEDRRKYQEAYGQFERLLNARENTRVQKAREAHNRLWDYADNYGGTVDQMKEHFKSDWGDLTVPLKQDLRNWEAQKAAGIVRNHSDRDVLQTLFVLQAQGNKGLQIYDYVTNNRSKLNETDFRTWAEIGATGLVGEKIEPLMSAYSQIKLVTDKEGWNSSDVLDAINGITTRYYKFTDENRRNPRADEMQEMVDHALTTIEVKTPWYRFDKKVRPFSADDEGRVQAMLTKPTVRQQFAFASQFDREVEDKLIVEIFRNNYPDLYKDAMSTFTPGLNPEAKYVVGVLMTLARQRGVDHGNE